MIATIRGVQAFESGNTYDGPIVVLVFSFPFALGCVVGYGTRL